MSAGIDPELLMRLSKEVSQVYADGVAIMLEKVARRLARGIDTPGWAEEKLVEQAALRKELQLIVQRLEIFGPEALDKAVREALVVGANSTAKEVGVGQVKVTTALEGTFSKTSQRAVRAITQEAITGVKATHGAILRQTADAYRNIVAETASQIVTGTQTRRQAAQAALDRFARKGITGFQDALGRNWELESYAEMTARTASGRAMVEGSLDRMASAGRDLVIVSDAPEECRICRPWEGRVLSIGGANSGKLEDGIQVAGTVADAIAAGLMHANCRHNLTAYFPGRTKRFTHTADPAGDRERQRQRTLERQVRAAKRKELTERAWVDEDRKSNGPLSPEAQSRLRQAENYRREAEKRMDEFIKETDRKRLRYREQVTSAR